MHIVFAQGHRSNEQCFTHHLELINDEVEVREAWYAEELGSPRSRIAVTFTIRADTFSSGLSHMHAKQRGEPGVRTGLVFPADLLAKGSRIGAHDGPGELSCTIRLQGEYTPSDLVARENLGMLLQIP